MGVLLHVLGDAVNNVGVIIASLVIWRTDSPGRYYADPAVGLAIALMILLSSIPLGMSFILGILSHAHNSFIAVKKSGTILLECVPIGVDLKDVKHDLEAVCRLTSETSAVLLSLSDTWRNLSSRTSHLAIESTEISGLSTCRNFGHRSSNVHREGQNHQRMLSRIRYSFRNIATRARASELRWLAKRKCNGCQCWR
jgi:Co/Zn/Cd efflux system component